MKKWLGAMGLVMVASVCNAVQVGDKAPPLEGVKSWLNGKAVNPADADGKTIFVVEFWATWCGPCKMTIPHLNDLQAKFRDKGVVFVGVTDETEDLVKPFAEKQGMKYLVAIDSANTTANTWRKSVEGIPHAFVVDKKGIVVWEGHPMQGLDDVIEKVIAGNYDPEKAKAAQDKQNRLMQMMMSGDSKGAAKLLDEMLAESPRDLELNQMKCAMLFEAEDNEGVHKQFRKMFDVFQDSADDLNTLAWMIVNAPLAMRDMEIAWKAATQADSMTQHKEPSILDTLANVYYQLGFLEKAVEAEKKAIELSKDGDQKKQFEGSLKYLEKIQEIRRGIEENKGAATPASAPK